jgi:hypothetical protein
MVDAIKPTIYINISKCNLQLFMPYILNLINFLKMKNGAYFLPIV